jgi:hypothetical protein
MGGAEVNRKACANQHNLAAFQGLGPPRREWFC